MTHLRFVDSGAQTPEVNMATDALLLEQAHRGVVLRVYGWSEPAVSIGRFQSVDSAQPQTALYEHLRWVRRATGGGAVVHTKAELTYALAGPLSVLAPSTGTLGEACCTIHGLVVRALADVGVHAHVQQHERQLADTATPPPFLCYARSWGATVDVGTSKLVGSAQRRRGKWLLQHGSIPLSTCAHLGTDRGADRALLANAQLANASFTPLTVSSAAGSTISYAQLAQSLRNAIPACFGGSPLEESLTCAEQARVSQLASSRYAQDPRVAEATDEALGSRSVGVASQTWSE